MLTVHFCKEKRKLEGRELWEGDGGEGLQSEREREHHIGLDRTGPDRTVVSIISIWHSCM